MRFSAIDLSSDSSDNEDSGRRNMIRTKYTCEKDSTPIGAQRFFYGNYPVQREPLFKIIFRDERTSRIYRKRLEDILKYLVAAKLDEDSEANSTDLVLEIHAPNDNFNNQFNYSDIIGPDQNQTLEIDYNKNYIASNFDKEIKEEAIVRGGAGRQNEHVLPRNLYDQPNHILDEFNWGIQQQMMQQSSVQSEYSLLDNFNIRKRKWVDDSDHTYIAKLDDSHCEPIETSSYSDPMWWNSSNAQSVPTNQKKPKKSAQPKVTGKLTQKKCISAFNYSVLKVGTFDYTKKKIFTISQDGILLYAHRLSQTSTPVKVFIEMTNIANMQVRFHTILQALFIYINEKAAVIIRKALGINNDTTAYLDPQSQDENCNKIIILSDNIGPNCKIFKALMSIGRIKSLDKKCSLTLLRNSFSKTLGVRSIQTQQCATEFFLNIESPTIKIGTYKHSHKLFDVTISCQGFKFQVPKVGDDKIYKRITIDFAEIVKLYFSLKEVSALFLHVNTSCAQRIRSLIEMPETDARKVYFNPDSKSIAEQRLVIIFNPINVHQQNTLKSLLMYTYSAEISVDQIINQMLCSNM